MAMTPIEIISLIFAIMFFCRGGLLLFSPKRGKAILKKFSSKSKLFYRRFSWMCYGIAMLLMYFILQEVPLLHIIVAIVATSAFITGFMLCDAPKESTNLWKAFLKKPNNWWKFMGAANMAVGLILLWLLR